MSDVASNLAEQASKPPYDDLIANDSVESGVFSNTSFAQVLINYWQAAIRWKWLIAGLVVSCVMIGIVFTMLQPRLYTASSVVQIDRGKRNITNVAGIEQPNSIMSDEFYNTQYALLKARSLAERVSHNLKLGEKPDFLFANGVTADDLDQTSKSSQSVSTSLIKKRENVATGILMGGIAIHPQHNSSLVDISFTSRSPYWATLIANAWPEQYIAANIDHEIAATADARHYLESRLSALRVRLEQSEQNLIRYAAQQNIVTFGSRRDAEGKTESARTLAESNLDALSAALLRAKTELITARSRAGGGAGRISTDIVENVTISALQAKRHDLEGQYAKLMVQFRPEYPAARAVKSEMNSIDAAISRETARVNGTRFTTLAQTSRGVADLQSQVNAARREFDQQQSATIQYHIYQREVDTNRQLYDSLLQRYKDIGIAGDVGANNIVVVDQARLPSAPSSPNLRNNVLAALLGGLLLSGMVVFGLETIGEGIRFPGDVERLLHLPLIGATPLIDKSPWDRLGDPKSQISEAYFSVATALSFATHHGLPKSMVVTSAQPDEGKSTSALGIATAIGNTGKRVLLIDGDMRSPSVHKMLGLPNIGGLSNILSGSPNLLSFIGKTQHKNVSAILAGPSPLNPVELLSGGELTKILSALQESFDHIVIDSPPVVGIADALILGKAVEATVLVVQAEGAAIRIIQAALQRLLISQNRVLGAVVTKVNFGRFGYGYSYDYGYGRHDEDMKLAAE